MSYDIICPSAPYENMTVHDEGKAYDLCYSLAEDYGYCQIRVNGIIFADYTVWVMFNQDELSALADLITFHDDWDEVSERVGVDVEQLYNKVIAQMSYNAQGWWNSK